VHRYVGELVTRATYGDRVWEEMGQDLLLWNRDAIAVIAEAAFSFWLVDVFHFCEYRGEALLQLKS
jgi:hypothetical protein